MPQSVRAIDKPLLVGVIFLGTFLAFANIPLVQAICLPGQNKIWSQNCPVAGPFLIEILVISVCPAENLICKSNSIDFKLFHEKVSCDLSI
jgi:hypothetical protein